MRLLVTGTQGQLVRSLMERAPSAGVEIVAIGRPQLDMADLSTVRPALEGVDADAIVNAAAYTAVDKAEGEEDLATRVNGEAAGEIASLARRRNLPFLHISTDYVFDGAADRPYRENDPTGPIGAYGRSKLAGEHAAAEMNPDTTILRTAWVYSPFGANFVKTMLRLGETRKELSVVADQRGNPSYALDLADAVIAVARKRIERRNDGFGAGVYHLAGSGEATWADLAEEVFAEAARLGRAPVAVKRITAADYPTPATRPGNSRLDTCKLAGDFGVVAPNWRNSARHCVRRLLQNV
jgi:dTDP-4-dehydrorhamnose reductase